MATITKIAIQYSFEIFIFLKFFGCFLFAFFLSKCALLFSVGGSAEELPAESLRDGDHCQADRQRQEHIHRIVLASLYRKKHI